MARSIEEIVRIYDFEDRVELVRGRFKELGITPQSGIKELIGIVASCKPKFWNGLDDMLVLVAAENLVLEKSLPYKKEIALGMLSSFEFRLGFLYYKLTCPGNLFEKDINRLNSIYSHSISHGEAKIKLGFKHPIDLSYLARAHFYRGIIAKSQESKFYDFSEAIEHGEESLIGNTKLPGAYMLVASAYQKRSESRRADDLDRATDLECSVYYANIAWDIIKTENPKSRKGASEKLFSVLFKTHLEKAKLLEGNAPTEQRMDELHTAIRYADSAFRLGKRDRFFLNDLSYAYWLLSELEQKPEQKEVYLNSYATYKDLLSRRPSHYRLRQPSLPA